MRMFNKSIVVFFALVAFGLSAVPAAANPVVREKVMRAGTEKDVTVMIQPPKAGMPPRFVSISGDPELRYFTGQVPFDGAILVSVLSGKSPEVRGERDIEKKPIVLKWRLMGEGRGFHILDLQNKDTEEKRKKELKKQGLPEKEIKQHELYLGLLEGEIPAKAFRPGDVLHIVCDFDQHDDRIDIKLVVTNYTYEQHLLFEAAEANPAAQAALNESLGGGGGSASPSMQHRSGTPSMESPRSAAPAQPARQPDDFEQQLERQATGNQSAPVDPLGRAAVSPAPQVQEPARTPLPEPRAVVLQKVRIEVRDAASLRNYPLRMRFVGSGKELSIDIRSGITEVEVPEGFQALIKKSDSQNWRYWVQGSRVLVTRK